VGALVDAMSNRAAAIQILAWVFSKCQQQCSQNGDATESADWLNTFFKFFKFFNLHKKVSHVNQLLERITYSK
jgi:hypothetical protein